MYGMEPLKICNLNLVFALGELELPFITLLLVIVAPHQVMKLRLAKMIIYFRFYLHSSIFMLIKSLRLSFYCICRNTQEGVIFSLVISAYLAFQHFYRAGSLRKAFDQGSVIASLAIICIVAVSCLLLVWLFAEICKVISKNPLL